MEQWTNEYKRALLQRCKQYYEIEGNSTGGNLHIILDDDNTERHCIYFCLKKCIENKDELGEETCREFIKLTKSQVNYICNNFWKQGGSEK